MELCVMSWKTLVPSKAGPKTQILLEELPYSIGLMLRIKLNKT